MHKIKEKLMETLYEYEEKLGKMSGGSISTQDLEKLHKLTDTVKNIDKIEMLEDSGYSEATDFMGEGRMYGMSYEGGMSNARGRGRNARRDRMGRYSREGGYSEEGYSEEGGGRGGRGGNRGGNRGGSNRGGYSNEGYSREGYSRGDAKSYMIEQLEEMMEDADNEKEREALKRCMTSIQNA